MSARSTAGRDETGHRPRRWLLSWGPAVAYMAVIFLVSGLPDLPHPRGPLWSVDKVQHMTAYFGLGLFAFRASVLWPLIARPGAFGQSLLVTALYGATDEWHQKFIPGRRCEFLDWLADVGGVLAALAIIFAIQYIRANGGRPIGGRR